MNRAPVRLPAESRSLRRSDDKSEKPPDPKRTAAFHHVLRADVDYFLAGGVDGAGCGAGSVFGGAAGAVLETG